MDATWKKRKGRRERKKKKGEEEREEKKGEEDYSPGSDSLKSCSRVKWADWGVEVLANRFETWYTFKIKFTTRTSFFTSYLMVLQPTIVHGTLFVVPQNQVKKS